MRQYIAILLILCITSLVPKRNVSVPDRIIYSIPTPMENFMAKIADIETPDGGYTTVNRYGMLGRYQFSPRTLLAVGIKVPSQEFLNNKELQDTAMVRLMVLNQQELSDIIEKYDGRIVKGIRITRATILAGAHFAGAGGVKQFLINDDYLGTVDGLGTSLRKYMSHFSDFQLPPVRG